MKKLKKSKTELLKFILKEPPFCVYGRYSESEDVVMVNDTIFKVDDFIQTALGYLELQKMFGRETMRTMDKYLPYYQKHKRL